MKKVIEIQEDVRLPGTDVLLEKGDRIQIFSESYAKVVSNRDGISIIGLNDVEVAVIQEALQVYLQSGKPFVNKSVAKPLFDKIWDSTMDNVQLTKKPSF